MKRRFRWISFVAAVVLGWAVLLPGLVSTAWQTVETYRPVAVTPTGEMSIEPLSDGKSFGLKFVAPEDGLAGLQFKVVTYKRINPARLVLLLYRLKPGQGVKPDPADRVPCRRSVIEAAGLQDWGPATFRFRPVRNSAGQPYYAVVMSPG
ncbi:MAG: hypothetical protein JRJ59_10910, partial [Deltaproteobacteria bacterium]|nr:hypothetical protein [Deltaproteobacteria bacterium]